MTDLPIPDGPARAALETILEALDIPNGATVRDQETRNKILIERAGHARAMLDSILNPDRAGQPDTEWSVAYLRARLAEHPATGYRTWAERMAELDAS